MSDDDVRALLEHRRRELDAELAALTDVPRDPVASISFGKRVGDGTNEAVERLTRTATAGQLAKMAANMDRALAKLDEKTYGRCDACGGPIPPERIEAIPWAVLCVNCAR